MLFRGSGNAQIRIGWTSLRRGYGLGTSWWLGEGLSKNFTLWCQRRRRMWVPHSTSGRRHMPLFKDRAPRHVCSDLSAAMLCTVILLKALSWSSGTGGRTVAVGSSYHVLLANNVFMSFFVRFRLFEFLLICSVTSLPCIARQCTVWSLVHI